MPTYIALLRGVNVGASRSVPMARLKAMMRDLGFEAPETLLQSGNVVFGAKVMKRETLEAKLEKALQETFAMPIDVMVRTPAELEAAHARNPFPDGLPKMVHLHALKTAPPPGAEASLKAACAASERVKLIGQDLFIDYGAGVARSKLSPAVLEKTCGATGTARNLNTLEKLAALAAAR